MWSPKYRRKVLVGKVEERLKELIAEVVEEKQGWLIEVEMTPDHVHLLVEVDPRFGIHRMGKAIEGRTSRLLRKELPYLASLPGKDAGHVEPVVARRSGRRSPALSSEALRREPEGRLMGRYETTGTRKRTREKGAPTYVATVPLDPSPAELALALTPNRAGLRLYNAALTEAKKRSKAAEATKKRVSETYPTMAEGRDRDHGNLVNRLYALGDDLRCEGLDYRSWQKNWSHSIRDRAPGAFVEKARRRGKALGEPIYEYDPRLALSQTCIGGEQEKKQLSERRHVCETHGLDVDRDLFSAFLGLHVERVGDGDALDLVGARNALSERAGAIAPQRQDLDATVASSWTPWPEKTPGYDGEKPRVRRRPPPGRRSLVRVRKRLASKSSDRVVRPEDGNTTPDGNAIPDGTTIPAPAPAGGPPTAPEAA